MSGDIGFSVTSTFENSPEGDPEVTLGPHTLGLSVEVERSGNEVCISLRDVATLKEIAYTNMLGHWIVSGHGTYQRLFNTAAK